MRYQVLLTALAIFVLLPNTANAVDIVWDGGDGFWNSANWNGGQTAQAVFGRVDGLEVGGAEIGTDAYINSGNVVYDPNEGTGTDRDFRYRRGGTLNIAAGASLNIESNFNGGFVDGYWTEWDGYQMNLNGGSFIRTFAGNQISGGVFIMGSWRSETNQRIEVNVRNGGLFQNDGQFWFGDPSHNEAGIQAILTISDDGVVDLTGGANVTREDDGVLMIDNDLMFAYGHDETDLKNEEYAIDFRGSGGTLITDEGGVIVAEQDAVGSWVNRLDGTGDGTTLVSYLDLWSMGILRARGATAVAFSSNPVDQETKFNQYFTVTGTPGTADYTLTAALPNAQVVWDGGDGDWRDANWNGGQTVQTLLGRENGVEFGTTGEVGADVVINSGTVTYDPNETTGTDSDFRYRRAGTLTINSGATWQHDSNDNGGFVDGYWTEWDGEAINVNGGTFRRTFSGNQISGGAMILGSWRSFDGQNIEVKVTNGGRIENDGQWWFGAPADNAQIDVTMTINDGDLDFTGGDNATLANDGVLLITADLGFFYSHDGTDPIGENYVINFTGFGSITVDAGGIVVAEQDASGFWHDKIDGGGDGTTLMSYEDLWDMGILQANGHSGLSDSRGLSFSDFFTVTGTVGGPDYTLSIGHHCGDQGADFDMDCDIDGDDFLLWQVGFGITEGATKMDGDADNDGDVDGDDFLYWQSEFGNGSGSRSVPEPTSVLLALIAASAFRVVTISSLKRTQG